MTFEWQKDEAEQAFVDWVDGTPRGDFPNCETNVSEAAVALESFTSGYEIAKAKYNQELRRIVLECSRVAKLQCADNRVCDAIEKHFGIEI